MPDSNVAIGNIHPVPLTVDIPAKATISKTAPSKRKPRELVAIPTTRTKVLMNLAHPRVEYDRF